MTPVIQQQYAPPASYKLYPNRPVTYIGAHHTADTQGQAAPTPKAGSSWHRLFRRNHVIFHTVPLAGAAHAILKTDLWTPPSIIRCPGSPPAVSDANYCGLQYEIEYAPQQPYNEIPADDQIEDFIWQYRQDTALFGILPIIPHGLVQSDKWDTEPHGLHWEDAGFQWVDGVGYLPRPVNTEPDVTNPATDDEIKGWLETAGTSVNMQTGIMQLAASSFRNGPPPTGEWRGPALGGPNSEPGEYSTPEGKIRHRFTQGIIEYDPATGGVGWVEVILHPN